MNRANYPDMANEIERCDKIKWGAGQTALPRLYPLLTMQPGETLYLFPDDTKTGAKDGPMEAVMTGDELCCITWIHRMLAAYDAAGHAITNFLTRPQASSGKQNLPQGTHTGEKYMPLRAINDPAKNNKEDAINKLAENKKISKELCCITWIHRMLAAYDAAGHAITNFLTRPQAS
jgi:hypothetical protein